MASSSRRDGRELRQTRRIAIELGQLSRADGSGRFAFGATAAVASFAGPIEVRLREELPDRATLEITHRPLEGIGATPSRALEQSLVSILTPLLDLAQHPRSLIQIVVQSLSASQNTEYPQAGPSTAPSDQKSWPADSIDGESRASSHAAPLASTPFSARAAAINAVALSALDAGSIAMRAVPVAVSVAFVPSRRRQNGFPAGSSAASGDAEAVMVLDPTPEEEKRASSRHGFCWAFGQGIAADPTASTGSGVKAEDDEDEEMIVYQPRTDNSGLESANRTEAELVWVESEGSFDRQQFTQALEASRRAAEDVLSQIRSQLAERFARKA